MNRSIVLRLTDLSVDTPLNGLEVGWSESSRCGNEDEVLSGNAA